MRLSLILPTYNEAENLPELLRRVTEAANPAEIIVVDDDSPDRTWEEGERLRSTYPALRVIRRIGEKGLSSAVVRGCDEASGDVLVVMDSDLQHDPVVVSSLAACIERGADIAVASRYRSGGSVGEWVRSRRWLSRLGTFVARKLPNVETTDPMSGFFAIRADAYRRVRHLLKPEGFKILFELLAAMPRGSRVDEVPLHFHPRLHGQSKLSLWVQVQFVKQVVRLGLRRLGLSGTRLFAIVVLPLAAVLFVRTWPLRSLYLDASLRDAAQRQIRDVALSKGWLVSDIRIDAIQSDGTMRVTHRRHQRGDDPETCWILPSTGEPVPCAD